MERFQNQTVTFDNLGTHNCSPGFAVLGLKVTLCLVLSPSSLDLLSFCDAPQSKASV